MTTTGYIDNWQTGKSLPECNLHMLSSETCNDVSFRVGPEEQVIRAHRYVLISRSCVFNAMLCGPLAEKDEITITDVSPDEFNDFLRYLYTANTELNQTNATAMLYLGRKYAVGSLEAISVSYLESCLNAENACIVMEQAHGFDVRKLYVKALNVIRENAAEVLTDITTSGFTDMCEKCFHEVITSAEALLQPEKVFTAAVSWAKAACERKGSTTTPENMRDVLSKELSYIYFPDMDQTFFVKTVVPSEILTDKECVKILSYHVCSDVGVAPFRTRFPKKTKVRPLPPTPTFALHLYNVFHLQAAKHQPDDIYCCDDVYIRCNKDIHLHGIHLFSSDRGNTKYRIKIFKNTCPAFGKLIHDVEITVSGMSSVHRVSTSRFVAPLALERNIQYHFQAQLVSGDFPLFTGKRDEKCDTRKLGCHEFVTEVRTVNPVRYISSFMFSEVNNKVTKMVEEPTTSRASTYFSVKF